MPLRSDRPLRHRKARDWALILPLVGFLLLSPLVASVVRVEADIGGVPSALVYVFAVWAALVAGAALLSRSLSEVEEGGSPTTAGGAAGGSRTDSTGDA